MIRRLRTESKMTQEQFANYFEIPKRSIENWETRARKCPEYLEKLIKYKLKKEGIIMKTYEFKYLNSIGEYIELNDYGVISIVERGFIARYTHEVEAIKKKYEDMGYTEKLSAIRKAIREGLGDCESEEERKALLAATANSIR